MHKNLEKDFNLLKLIEVVNIILEWWHGVVELVWKLYGGKENYNKLNNKINLIKLIKK